MNCDELIDQLLAENTPQADGPGRPGALRASACTEVGNPHHRERLAALAAGGQAMQALGRALTPDQVDGMDDEELEKLYARYEARLGASMTKTLRQAALQLYTGVASRFLPIPPENQPKLTEDLEADPFIGQALSTISCEMYHRYGMYLAPITAALTTAKYCQFEQAPCQVDGDNVGDTARRDEDAESDGPTRDSGANSDTT